MKTKKKKTKNKTRAKSSLRRFHIIFSAEELPREVLALDEEDAAERACTNWEANVDSVQVVDLEKDITYLVYGAREDGEWNSHGSEIQSPMSAQAPERTRCIDAAEAVLTALRNDRHEDAKKRLVDLARVLGDDFFTQKETQKLVALLEDAGDAKMSIGVYVEEMKLRIAIFERVTGTST